MSLNGLRRALAEDKTFARVRTEAQRPFSDRNTDYQISAPTGMRAVLLAEMADALASAGDDGAGCSRGPRRHSNRT